MPPTFAAYFTYADFNGGIRATPEQFQSRLSEFNGPAVVYICSVMNTVLRDWQGHTRTDANEEFVRNSFKPQIANRIIAEFNNPELRRGLYHRQQLLFVSKAALLICPESGGKDPAAPPHAGEFGLVLLMANDLLPKGLTGPFPTPDQLMNVLSEFIPIAEASGFYKAIHKVVRSRLMLDRFFPNGGANIKDVFKNATGLSLQHYFALCFATLCRYFDLDLKKYQSDPNNFVLSEGWYRTTPVPAEMLASFLSEVSASAEEFKHFLAKKKSATNDFTCFRSKPIFKAGDNHFLIDSLFLAEKSESGVFWRINEALSRSARLQFYQDWGLSFERYVNWLLSESIHESVNRIYPNPRFSDTGEEVCDAILLCSGSALFIEMKGATFTAEAKYGTDPDKLREEIEEKLIQTDGHMKGIGQLSLHIEEVFSRKSARRVEGVDLSAARKVFPVLITRDDIGSALLMNAYLASRFRHLFHRKSVAVTVTPPFTFSAQDIEMICGYLKEASFADLIEERYKADRNFLSTFWLLNNPIIERIGERECKPFSDALHEYFRDIANTLFPGADLSSAGKSG
jgi:hypothetical protein